MNDKLTALDCFQLWEIGVDELPYIAERYSNASIALGATGQNEAAFRARAVDPNPCNLDGSVATVSSYGAVSAAFGSVRDQLQNNLATTAQTMHALGKVVQLAAWTYAASDQANGDALDGLSDMIVEDVSLGGVSGNSDDSYTPHDPNFNPQDYAVPPEGIGDIPDGNYEQPDYAGSNQYHHG